MFTGAVISRPGGRPHVLISPAVWSTSRYDIPHVGAGKIKLPYKKVDGFDIRIIRRPSDANGGFSEKGTLHQTSKRSYSVRRHEYNADAFGRPLIQITRALSPEEAGTSFAVRKGDDGEILKSGTSEELVSDEMVRKLYLGRNFELR